MMTKANLVLASKDGAYADSNGCSQRSVSGRPRPEQYVPNIVFAKRRGNELAPSIWFVPARLLLGLASSS